MIAKVGGAWGGGVLRLKVTPPWLLARFACAVQHLMGQRGLLLSAKMHFELI
jgi:hypothetical protein